MPDNARRVFDGDPHFDTTILPEIEAIPFFRPPAGEEIDVSFAAYRGCVERGDATDLIEAWARVAEPTRAKLGGAYGFIYRSSGMLPRRVSGLSFLSTLRGVLDAGVRFRRTLRPETRASIERDFPWLERRHTHIPKGWSPHIDFPPAFTAYIDGGDLDDARARWALATGLNEVQQAHTSKYLGRLFGLPELERHAERERALALNYFAHCSPRATRELWRQTLYVLDALNAAVFDALCRTRAAAVAGRSLMGLVTGGAEWRAFVNGLNQTQELLPPPNKSTTPPRSPRSP